MEESAVLFGLFFLLQVSLSESPDVVGHEPVQATVGDNVILPCCLVPPTDVSALTVEWKRNELIVHLYRERADNYDEQEEQFRNRTSLFRHELSRGNISLNLTNVTEKDSGLYFCHVPRLESTVKRGNVNLSVLLTVSPQDDAGGREDKGGNDETEDDKKESGDQTGAIVGGVVSAVIVIILLVLLLVLGWKYEDTLKTWWNECWGTEKKNEENHQQGERGNALEMDPLNSNPDQNPQGADAQ